MRRSAAGTIGTAATARAVRGVLPCVLAMMTFVGFTMFSDVEAQRAKQSIAHRGASGYAPEHTIASYRLALEQKADFVEPDLAVSKDGVLVCLHDDTLERTTNVEETYPDRTARPDGRPLQVDTNAAPASAAKHWLANDFTVTELKRLDAGSWLDAKFAGERMPTFEEMVALVRGKAGIYPELKSPPLYTARGVDMEKIFVATVKKLGLDKPESLKTTPVIIQSFDWDTVKRVAVDLPTIPRVFLTDKDADVTEARLRDLAKFASGIAPNKGVIARNPDMVARAHAAGLTVTSWTFRADDRAMTFPSVKAEMEHFLYTLGIDALFTNNPDQFPRR